MHVAGRRPIFFKKRSISDWYTIAFRLMNILGPVAGALVVLCSGVGRYLETRPQKLPLEYRLVYNHKIFYLEVATKPEELSKGLKWRSSLPSDRGMLFNLGKQYLHVPFWMYHVKISLDIVYLQNNVVTAVVSHAPPCAKNPCPIYYGKVATHVLELPSGVIHIRVGEKLDIKHIPFQGMHEHQSHL